MSEKQEAKKEGYKIEVKTIKDMHILPAAPGTCPVCATAHPEEYPHNPQSLFYQLSFFKQHGRYPNWKDAMGHCSEQVKLIWANALDAQGIKIE